MEITIKGWITGRKIDPNLTVKGYQAPITDAVVHTSYDDARARFIAMSEDLSWGQPFIYEQIDIKIKL